MRGVSGMGQRDDKEIEVLSRSVRWVEEGIRYEADTKHRKKIMT